MACIAQNVHLHCESKTNIYDFQWVLKFKTSIYFEVVMKQNIKSL